MNNKKDFSNLSDKLEYYSDNEDYYFYKQLNLILDKDLEFFNKKKINFTLVMTILLNKLFGSYDFYDRFLYLYQYNIDNKIESNDFLLIQINDQSMDSIVEELKYENQHYPPPHPPPPPPHRHHHHHLFLHVWHFFVPHYQWLAVHFQQLNVLASILC